MHFFERGALPVSASNFIFIHFYFLLLPSPFPARYTPSSIYPSATCRHDTRKLSKSRIVTVMVERCYAGLRGESDGFGNPLDPEWKYIIARGDKVVLCSLN